MGNTSVKACEEPFLERLKNGDEVAFSELVNEHWNKIYNRANSLLDNHQDAEEVAQDTFIKARKSIGSFRLLNFNMAIPYSNKFGAQQALVLVAQETPAIDIFGHAG